MAARKSPVGKRKAVEISPADRKEIVRALEKWASTEDFLGLRLRAFVYLLWDGAVKTKVAMALDIEDVVGDGSTLRVKREVVKAASEANRYRELRFSLSKRTRAALTDYLRVVRRDGWLAGSRLEGPLFVSRWYKGEAKRMSGRTAAHSFREFLATHTSIRTDYSVDDIVYTGRMAFIDAGGDTSQLSKHAAVSEAWAARKFLRPTGKSTKDILDRLDEINKKL